MPDTRPVLSVPAGKIYDLIFEHLIYSCPGSPAYQYADTELITFRTAAGRMAQILKIQKIYTVRPEDLAAEFSIPEDHRTRIAAYITAARKSGVLEKPGVYRFYILDDEPVATLPHRPTPKTQIKGAAYFTMTQLTSGAPIVVPISEN
jgi:hypothetical protein